MKKITVYQVPALLHSHPSLTAYEVYASDEDKRPPFGVLQSLINEAIIAHIVEQLKLNGTPTKKWDVAVFGENDLTVTASSIIVGNDVLLTPIHIASFMHRSRWASAGVPPIEIAIQMQTRMLLHGLKQAYIGALVDKTVHIYEVAEDAEMQSQIKKALSQFADHIRTQTPPAIDETPAPTANNDQKLDAESTDDLARAWLETRQEKANASTLLKIADSRLSSYDAALLKRLAPGKSLTIGKTRIIHNAKSGDLKTESSDDSYF